MAWDFLYKLAPLLGSSFPGAEPPGLGKTHKPINPHWTLKPFNSISKHHASRDAMGTCQSQTPAVARGPGVLRFKFPAPPASPGATLESLRVHTSAVGLARACVLGSLSKQRPVQKRSQMPGVLVMSTGVSG